MRRMKGDGDGNGKSIVGVYLKEAKDFSLLSLGEEKRLFQQLKRGDKEARNKLINANQLLIVQIAKKHQHFGLAILDLIQEGNIGLMRAIEKFDWRKGYKFSTYATPWVRAFIIRAITDQSRVVRLPVYINNGLNKIWRVKKQFLKEKGQTPTLEEIAEEMGVSLAKVENLINISKETISLDAPIGNEGESGEESNLNLEDIIVDQNTANPEEELKKQDLRKEVDIILSSLSPREEKILRRRFGIGENKEYTLQEIGNDDEFQLTRERIRQIEAKALEKIKEKVKKAGMANPLLE